MTRAAPSRVPALGAVGPPGLRHAGRIEVQAGDPPGRADSVEQQVQDPFRPAAKVDRAAARGDPDPVQQRLAVLPQLGGLVPQPVLLGRAVPSAYTVLGPPPGSMRLGHVWRWTVRS